LPVTITPSSPISVPVPSIDLVLMETPPKEGRKNCKAPADCHILINWSQLVDLIKNNFTCMCGQPILDFERRTIGIAAEIDFNCKSCKKTVSALAGYVEENLETSFIQRERCIDNYEMSLMYGYTANGRVASKGVYYRYVSRFNKGGFPK
jgi:hypothetical protein